MITLWTNQKWSIIADQTYQVIFITKLYTLFFSVQLLSVLRGHSFCHPRHNGQ